MESEINKKLISLSKSNFRSSFHLNKKMISYISEKGFDVIEKHTSDFVNQKLAPANPLNDGKQTPMKNHPTFIAMHACACCCRSCLYKWHHIPKNRALNDNEIKYINLLLLTWIKSEYNKKN